MLVSHMAVTRQDRDKPQSHNIAVSSHTCTLDTPAHSDNHKQQSSAQINPELLSLFPSERRRSELCSHEDQHCTIQPAEHPPGYFDESTQMPAPYRCSCRAQLSL